jgi:hypothetical protein
MTIKRFQKSQRPTERDGILVLQFGFGFGGGVGDNNDCDVRFGVGGVDGNLLR